MSQLKRSMTPQGKSNLPRRLSNQHPTRPHRHHHAKRNQRGNGVLFQPKGGHQGAAPYCRNWMLVHSGQHVSRTVSASPLHKHQPGTRDNHKATARRSERRRQARKTRGSQNNRRHCVTWRHVQGTNAKQELLTKKERGSGMGPPPA